MCSLRSLFSGPFPPSAWRNFIHTDTDRNASSFAPTRFHVAGLPGGATLSHTHTHTHFQLLYCIPTPHSNDATERSPERYCVARFGVVEPTCQSATEVFALLFASHTTLAARSGRSLMKLCGPFVNCVVLSSGPISHTERYCCVEHACVEDWEGGAWGGAEEGGGRVCERMCVCVCVCVCVCGE